MVMEVLDWDMVAGLIMILSHKLTEALQVTIDSDGKHFFGNTLLYNDKEVLGNIIVH
jgi:hypothetical protein